MMSSTKVAQVLGCHIEDIIELKLAEAGAEGFEPSARGFGERQCKF